MATWLHAGHEYFRTDGDCPFDFNDEAYVQALEQTKIEAKPKADKVVLDQGVEMNVYLEFIKNELETEANCLQLPMTILLLLSFAFLATAHLGQKQIYAVEESIEFDITENANFAFAHAFGHKGLVDVNSIADFWSWMRLGFFPLSCSTVVALQ
jgi:hypothetical protein